MKEKLNMSVQNKYYSRYLEDEDKVKENEEKIRILEKLEDNLLEKLQLTVNKQVNMHKTLESLIRFGRVEQE